MISSPAYPEASVTDPRSSEQRRADAYARLARWFPTANPFDLARLLAETHDALWPGDREAWTVGEWSFVARFAAATALLGVRPDETDDLLTAEQRIRLRLTEDRRDL